MGGSTASYCEMDEATFAASPFLDNRMVSSPSAKKIKARIGAVVKSEPWVKTPPPVPSRYILHISHVGSTLLSRVVGVSPSCLSLREPVPLRYLAQNLMDQGSSAAWHSTQGFDALVDFALRNMGRPLGNRSRVVVKCTSWVNPLGEHFLSRDAGNPMRVAAVHVPVAHFVANTLKGSAGQQDLRSNAPSRIRRLQKLLPGFDRSLHAMNWGQIAAMSWLCEILTIRSVCERPGVALQWLNFDGFMQKPAEEVRHLAQHLDLEWDDGTDRMLADSGIMGKYSKGAKAVEFSNDQRVQALAKFMQENPNLITSAREWIVDVMKGHKLADWFGSAEGIPQL